VGQSELNGVVLHRELVALGFSGSYQQVQRLLKPRRDRPAFGRKPRRCGSRLSRANRRRSITASSRSGSESSRRRFTCSCIRWLFAALVYPWYRNERLATLLDGHERAFRHFGGVTLSCLYDNPRTLVLGRRENKVLWHPLFEDFAATTVSRRGPASHIGRAPRVRSRAG